MVSRVWKPDETLALVFEIVHKRRLDADSAQDIAYCFDYFSKRPTEFTIIVIELMFLGVDMVLLILALEGGSG